MTSHPQKYRYIIRVEGVNLANVIDDTDQLSVRRGGGLMILNAASSLKRSLDKEIGDRLTEIATGASIGLFVFEAASDDEAETVRKAVEKHFREGALDYTTYDNENDRLSLKHGTFVVDVVQIDQFPNEQQAEQQATAQNRWRQLQQPTLSLEGIWGGPAKFNDFCYLDRTRPAETRLDLNADEKQKPVSRTVRDRWHYGRGARRHFYQTELARAAREDAVFAKILGGLEFTDDLQELSGHSQNVNDGETVIDFAIPENLIDKLAVFYVDGNGFGQRGRKIFQQQGCSGFCKWSIALREHHQDLLKGLITLTEDDRVWRNGNKTRLETLLWGGDEILWVVPAWKGWELAKWFFSQQHSVEVRGETIPLSYGCGLVFCHAKAPIKNISALAHRLGDLAKETREEENMHCLAYEVLESYDDVSGDLEDHRRRFLPADEDVKRLVVDPGSLENIWETLATIANCNDFPMRQLYMLAKKWRAGQDFEEHAKRLRAACEQDDVKEIDIDAILNSLGDPHGWLHLLQMLPYLTGSFESASEVAR